jgi:tripartite-type tricarboxylate transporter receptor subunit TctC
MLTKPSSIVRRRRVLQALGAGCAVLLAGSGAAHAAEFPAKPIRIVVPFPPGSALEPAIRMVGEKFQKETGQPLIVENKPGGSGIIAAQLVANAKPDGYTILLGTPNQLAINPHTRSSLPYDPVNGFKAITNFMGGTMVLAVHKDVPANNLKDFIGWVKANPGKVSYASFTAGNTSHFAGTILNDKAKIDMMHIPFPGSGPAVQNLVGGQVHAAFVTPVTVKNFNEQGRVKVLAATGAKRSPLMPSVPTFRELGYPEMEMYLWAGLYAPAGTPDPIIRRLNALIAPILRAPDVVALTEPVDLTPQPSTPEELTEYTRSEYKRWGQVVKMSGFKATD